MGMHPEEIHRDDILCNAYQGRADRRLVQRVTQAESSNPDAKGETQELQGDRLSWIDVNAREFEPEGDNLQNLMLRTMEGPILAWALNAHPASHDHEREMAFRCRAMDTMHPGSRNAMETSGITEDQIFLATESMGVHYATGDSDHESVCTSIQEDAILFDYSGEDTRCAQGSGTCPEPSALSAAPKSKPDAMKLFWGARPKMVTEREISQANKSEKTLKLLQTDTSDEERLVPAKYCTRRIGRSESFPR